MQPHYDLLIVGGGVLGTFHAYHAPEKGLRVALRDATEALNRATTPFAGKRMDARVRQALSGQRVDQLAA